MVNMSLVPWFGLLMGSLLVVTAQMKRDQREMSVQLVVPLSKSAVTKGTNSGEVVLEEHELNPSSFTSNDMSDWSWRRTFIVGQDLSVQLHKKLCPHPSGNTRIHGLCNLYGVCGRNSLTFRSCRNSSNSALIDEECRSVCPTEHQSNCNLFHDMMIIRKLFQSNDSQSLENIGDHLVPATDSTNVSTRHMLTNNSVPTAPEVGNTTTLQYESLEKAAKLTTWKSSFSCANFSNGKLFSYPASCRQFVECMDRVPTVKECPSGTIFNPKLLICDNRDNVIPHFCSGENTITNNYDSLKIRKNKAVVPQQRRIVKRKTFSSRREMSKICSVGNDQGSHYIQPHPLHCNQFEICSNGKIKVETCGTGSLFNPLSLVCDLASNVDCEGRRIDFSTYDCQPGDKYRTSHPDKCNLFIECDKGNLAIKSCPPGTSYDFEAGDCVHIYRAKCKKPISLEHDSDVNYSPDQRRRHKRSESLNLACTFNYIAPHPHFCNKFVECENGRIFIKDCGPGTAYNPRLGQCDWPYNVRQPVPVLDDCSRYRQCHGTRYIDKSCGGTTIYDQEKGKCVFPTGRDYETNCKKEEIITPPPS